MINMDVHTRVSGLLKSILGPGFNGPDDYHLISEIASDYKRDAVIRLYPAVSYNKKILINKAFCHTYPTSYELLSSQEMSGNQSVPTFYYATSLISLWSILISKDFQFISDALINNDMSLVDKIFDDDNLDMDNIDNIRTEIVHSTIAMLKQIIERVNIAEESKPVSFVSNEELAWIIFQRKHSNSNLPYYKEAHSHFILKIDPSHDVDVITQIISDMIKEYYKDTRIEHINNWSKEEYEYFGEEYINSIDPVKEFTLKDDASKSRGKQFFIDNAFHSLLIYELRKTYSPSEIERNFFDMKDIDYNSKTTDNRRRYNFAEKIINNSLSGLPAHI